MKDRRAFLASVFAYTFIGLTVVQFLSSLSWFVSNADWIGILLKVSYVVIGLFVVFVWPKIPTGLAKIPQGWLIGFGILISMLAAWLAVDGIRMNLANPITIPGITASGYIDAVAAGLVCIINIGAILVSARAGQSQS